MKLEICNLSVQYEKRRVLHELSLTAQTGEILCLLGPNGVGKTTLFKNILGLINPTAGEISIDGENIRRWSSHRRARIFAYVPQAHVPPFDFSVLDVVTMGRTVFFKHRGVPSAEDEEKALSVLQSLGIEQLSQRSYAKLSGGERQMVLIARALAQEPAFLVMDEPTANLDFGNQAIVLRQIHALGRKGLGVIMSSHSPEHALACADRVALFCRDGTLIQGAPDQVVTQENLFRVYGVETLILSARDSQNRTIKSCVFEMN